MRRETFTCSQCRAKFARAFGACPRCFALPLPLPLGASERASESLTGPILYLVGSLAYLIGTLILGMCLIVSN